MSHKSNSGACYDTGPPPTCSPRTVDGHSGDSSDTKTLVNAGLSEGSNDGNIHTEDVTCKIQSSLVAKHSNLEHFLFPFQWSSEGGIVGPDQLVVLDEV